MGKTVLLIVPYSHNCIDLARNVQWRKDYVVEYHIVTVIS